MRVPVHSKRLATLSPSDLFFNREVQVGDAVRMPRRISFIPSSPVPDRAADLLDYVPAYKLRSQIDLTLTDGFRRETSNDGSMIFLQDYPSFRCCRRLEMPLRPGLTRIHQIVFRLAARMQPSRLMIGTLRSIAVAAITRSSRSGTSARETSACSEPRRKSGPLLQDMSGI